MQLKPFLLIAALSVAPAAWADDVNAGDARATPCVPADAVVSVNNFHTVAPGIFRGGQPTPANLLELKRAGVKTIINLRNEPVLVKQEEQQAKDFGLSYVNIPLDVFNPPPESSVKQFLSLVSDASNQPVYVHCLHGQDRTGTMVALYRIEKQGWSADQAYAEMLQCGFRPGFSRLSRAVFAHGAAAGRPGTPPTGGDIITDLKKRFSKSNREHQ